MKEERWRARRAARRNDEAIFVYNMTKKENVQKERNIHLSKAAAMLFFSFLSFFLSFFPFFLFPVINDRHDQVVPRTSQTTTTKKRRNQNGIEAKLAIVCSVPIES